MAIVPRAEVGLRRSEVKCGRAEHDRVALLGVWGGRRRAFTPIPLLLPSPPCCSSRAHPSHSVCILQRAVPITPMPSRAPALLLPGSAPADFLVTPPPRPLDDANRATLLGPLAGVSGSEAPTLAARARALRHTRSRLPIRLR